jgi:type II secretory pathway pseudopilin PulG
MTPPAAATVARSRPSTAPDRRGGAPDRRPPLQVVGDRPRRQGRRRSVAVVSFGMIGASLLSVVVGHALLAQDQVRLSAVQSALSAEQSAHRQAVIAAAKLETPSRIVAKARQQGMAPPAQTNQLPRVPLTTPLATPNVAATTTTTTPPSAATTSTGTTSAGAASGTTTSAATASGATSSTGTTTATGSGGTTTSGTTPGTGGTTSATSGSPGQ